MGGAGGHMAHLHENTWLTFGEIKSFLTQVASAELSPFEKVDGQNIHFRWSPEGVMCARNDGQIKKGGLPEADYRAMWAGHPAEDAFIKGFEKIKSALESLSEEGKASFQASQPGSFRFCNCEIMYPENENLILYDGNYIVLHNLKELAIIGGKVEQTDIFLAGSPEFDVIVESLEDEQKSADAQEWQLFGPKYVNLRNLTDGTLLSETEQALSALGYSDSDKIFKLVEDKYQAEIAPGLPPEKSNALLQRIKLISEGAKTKDLPNLNAIKKGLDAQQKAVVTSIGSVTKAKKFIGAATAPVAQAISDFAIEVLRGLESFFVTDTDAEVLRLQGVLEDSIEALSSYEGDDAAKHGEMLEKQLAKLGAIENIASSLEGIIFEYPPGSQNLVKLTGSFAMANQIIGRAKRLPQPQPVPAQNLDAVDVFENFSYSLKELDMLYEAIGNQTFDSIAVIGGAFKPPHLGHLSMVDHYAALADKVIVYISNPKSAKSQRSIAGNPVTPDMSKQLWDLLVGGRPNVEVQVSSAPSPITIAYDSVMAPNPDTGHPGTPYEPGTTVYLGASVKGNDIKRFAGALKKASPDITVADPMTNAAPAAELPAEYTQKLNDSQYASQIPSVIKGADPKDFSASDFRFLLEQAQTDPVAKDLAGYFVGHDKIDRFMSILGLGAMVENKSFSKYSLKRYLL